MNTTAIVSNQCSRMKRNNMNFSLEVRHAAQR